MFPFVNRRAEITLSEIITKYIIVCSFQFTYVYLICLFNMLKIKTPQEIGMLTRKKPVTCILKITCKDDGLYQIAMHHAVIVPYTMYVSISTATALIIVLMAT